MDEKEQQLPEAPLSITVKGYFKGFSVMLTKRSSDQQVSEKLGDTVTLIERMIVLGFKPSWNEATNGAYTPVPKDPDPEWVREPIHTPIETPKPKIHWKKCTKHQKYYDGDKYAQCSLCAQGL